MNNDSQLLAEAYEQVLLKELNWKGPLAAAALATAAHGADADTVNQGYKYDNKPAVQQPAISKATEAYNKFRQGVQLNDQEVASLATDKEYAKEYIIHLRTHQLPIPEVLKNVAADTVRSTSRYIGG